MLSPRTREAAFFVVIGLLYTAVAATAGDAIEAFEAPRVLYLAVFFWPFIAIVWITPLMGILPVAAIFLGYKYGYWSLEVALLLCGAFLVAAAWIARRYG
jgi:hypothetical protein